MNYGEGEQLSKKMDSLGYVRTDSADDAEIIILNTCTVVETTEKKIIHRIGELKKSGKKVIVTGCMAKVQPKRISIRLPDSVILPPDMYGEFSNTIEKKFGSFEKITTSKKSSSAILPIAQGCLGNCSYCITRLARGKLKSYPVDDIVKEFESMLNNGAKEILLAAQDTACYGKDIGTNLPTLLHKLLQSKKDFRIRIGMMNPNYLEEIADELLDAMDDERIYKFLHIPVQSGSDKILESMRRHYDTKHFLEIVNKLRKKYPDISIATDFITGFPGEDDEDHKKSLDLIETLHADTANITRFSARPGTDAASMPQIQGNVSKKRSKELTDMKMKVEFEVNKKHIGKKYKVLVTEVGKPGTVITRNENYRPIGIEGNYELGTFLEIEITDSASTHMFGRVLR